ncbi:hypothetical protein LSAT2_020418 [Lamellibrachia satsuma]|nr:hypothetical protein LSAT2_020418 [Lamellibrachia satsuma]
MWGVPNIITSDRGSTSSHQTVVRHHHIRPWFDIITSERGSQFTSDPWLEVCHVVGIARDPTASYHPQYNGQLSSAIQRPAIIRNTTSSYHPQYNGQLSSAIQRPAIIRNTVFLAGQTGLLSCRG